MFVLTLISYISMISKHVKQFFDTLCERKGALLTALKF